MEIFSALLAICAGNSPVTGEFPPPPPQRPVTRGFDVFFELRLNKRLSKQSWGWWFETLSRPLWRYYDEYPTKKRYGRSMGTNIIHCKKAMNAFINVFNEHYINRSH